MIASLTQWQPTNTSYAHHPIVTPQPCTSTLLSIYLSLRSPQRAEASQSTHSPFVDQTVVRIMRARKHTKKQASKIQVANTWPTFVTGQKRKRFFQLCLFYRSLIRYTEYAHHIMMFEGLVSLSCVSSSLISRISQTQGYLEERISLRRVYTIVEVNVSVIYCI